MKEKLSSVLTRKVLLRQAGEIYFARGEKYYRAGNVKKLILSDNTLIATVVGTCRYKTSLTVKNGFLHGNCSCPLGDDGEFCKHLVATGLAFLNGEYITRECKKYFDWNTFIKRCSREVLEQIIFEMTPSCPDIIEEYRMKNLPDAPEKLIDELKQKFDSLTELAEECDCYDNYYDDENNYERFDKNFGQLKMALENIFMQKKFKELFSVAEYAIEELQKKGDLYGDASSMLLEQMQDSYAKAATSRICSDEYLLKKVLEWEDNTEYLHNFTSFFDKLPLSVKKMWFDWAIEKWTSLPPIKMGKANSSPYRRHLETRLLDLTNTFSEQALKLSILEKSLGSPGDVLKLYQEYKKQNKKQQILPLLIRAHKVFACDDDIREALISELQKKQDHTQALDIAWNSFKESPLLNKSFKILMETAAKSKNEKKILEKVLDLLSEYEVKENHQYHGLYTGNAFRIRRIEILLQLKMYDEAWIAGKDELLPDELKLKLAKWRSIEKPEDAAQICKALLAKALQPTGNDAYKNALKLLKLYKEYMIAAKQEKQFQQYCLWIRNEYKKRKNLIALMNKNHF